MFIFLINKAVLVVVIEIAKRIKIVVPIVVQV